jgi:hypothetical protein
MRELGKTKVGVVSRVLRLCPKSVAKTGSGEGLFTNRPNAISEKQVINSAASRLLSENHLDRNHRKNLSSGNPPHNDMVERSKGIYAGFAWHAPPLLNKSKFMNRKFEERP